MSKVAVTGGAGFVGSNLVRRLLIEGHDVVVVDDFSTGLKTNLQGLGCRVEGVSICDESALRKVLKDSDWVFHLAARGSVPRSIINPQATFEVNTKGTLNVLNVAREHGLRVVFSSSSSVYGRNNELPKNEESWMAPMSPYAASKLSGEAMVQSYAESFGIPATIFRFFNIYGPWQRPDHVYAAVIPKWIWNAMRGKELEIFGDGEHSRDFTHVDTVVEVLTQTLHKNFDYPTPINLAFGNSISLNQVIHEMKSMFPAITWVYREERKGDVRASRNDPTLITRLFPDVVPNDFSAGLRTTFSWLSLHEEQIANRGIGDD